MKSLILGVAILASGCSSNPSSQYAAVIRGTMASTDLTTDQMLHDQAAMGGEAIAKSKGDFAHFVQLGTNGILDSTTNEFLAVDRWTDDAAMESFYTNPAVFGTLFATPPTVEFFEEQTDWTQWGDMDSGETFNPYFFHFALGGLAQTDETANRDAHNQVAAAGEAQGIQAGNVAHVVFLGTHDSTRFLGIDIWNASTNIQAFYTDPNFVKVFAPLFSSISQPVFQSTNWYQW